ncbi:MAG: hypothetical protein NXI21_07365 [Alphaproteobacteria bacterium]|nr:hypothetical protein [Alphaproteobacteria bacterium]
MSPDAFETEAAAIAADRATGAADLARRALAALAESARAAPADDVGGLRALLERRAYRLADSRPSMAPMATLPRRFLQALGAEEARDLAQLRARAAEIAESLIERSRGAAGEAAAAAARRIGPGRTVATLSDSSTVRRALAHLAPDVRVIVGEARPLCEGAALASHLAGEGIEVALVTDAQLALAMTEADAALIGADALTLRGDTVNKVGSHLLALAAAAAAKPFFVVAESFKRWPADAPAPVFEEMDPAELGHRLDAAVRQRNVYFETVPAALITEIVTEESV